MSYLEKWLYSLLLIYISQQPADYTIIWWMDWSIQYYLELFHIINAKPFHFITDAVDNLNCIQISRLFSFTISSSKSQVIKWWRFETFYKWNQTSAMTGRIGVSWCSNLTYILRTISPIPHRHCPIVVSQTHCTRPHSFTPAENQIM